MVIYLVLSHVDSSYQNEFVGLYTSVELAKSFVENLISKAGELLGYSKITIHPIVLDKPFDTAFADVVLAEYGKKEGSNILQLL